MPYHEVLLAKVGLGAETTAMTKLVTQVNILESQLHVVTAERDALKKKAEEQVGSQKRCGYYIS